MVQLKFVDSTNGEPMGIINWYAVHLTSMNKTNRYISSDNKGYASLLFEEAINGQEVMPGNVCFLKEAFSITSLLSFYCPRVRL